MAVILRNEAYIGKAAYLKTMSSGKRTRHNRTGRQKAGAVRRLTSRTARAREEWIELTTWLVWRLHGPLRWCVVDCDLLDLKLHRVGALTCDLDGLERTGVAQHHVAHFLGPA